jgi:hypothetical protein
LSVDAARACITTPEGELKPDHAVEEPIAWSASESVPFAEYERLEAAMIASLLEGRGLRDVLRADPFPALEAGNWTDIASGLQAFHGPSRVAAAARWFGDALGFLVDRRDRTERERPWAASFARAARRLGAPEQPNRVFGDWLADEVWALRWTPFGSLARARAELATRLAVARRIAGWLDISDPKRDNIAAAEAVMIVDVVGGTDAWEAVQRKITD